MNSNFLLISTISKLEGLMKQDKELDFFIQIQKTKT